MKQVMLEQLSNKSSALEQPLKLLKLNLVCTKICHLNFNFLVELLKSSGNFLVSNELLSVELQKFN